MLQFVKGNIFDSDASVLVNPVNTVGTIEGLSFEFGKRFPINKLAYKDFCYWHTGMTILDVVQTKELGKIILNVPTKTNPKEPSKLEYIEQAVRGIRTFLKFSDNHKLSIAIPALGCGRGGLQWSAVKEKLESLSDLPNDIYIYEPHEE